MQHINLTKKVIGAGPLHISEDCTVITNGHWACKRDLLKQAPLLTSVDALKAMFPKAECREIPDASVAGVLPRYSDPIIYTRTPWVRTSRGSSDVRTSRGSSDAVLFVGETDSQMWISRIYVDLFELEEVKAPACSGKVCQAPGVVGDGDDWTVLVMPMREDYQEGLK
jgi:hypothetical protein